MTMNSNAMYIQNPNRLSTRVHYAPGGASSLSLGWEEPIQRHKRNVTVIQQPSKQNNYNNYNQLRSQNTQNYPVRTPQSSYEHKQPYKNYYEPIKSSSHPQINDSNKILEDELQYYQQRNKLLRDNIFGGYENPNYNNQYAQKYPQYHEMPQKNQNYGVNMNKDLKSYVNQPEQLDLAIFEQRKRKANMDLIMNHGPAQQERTSVKVHNPPGGRSTIVFG